MKKLAILAVAVLGTFSMVNAQTTPAAAPAKEVKVAKHDKKDIGQKAFSLCSSSGRYDGLNSHQ